MKATEVTTDVSSLKMGTEKNKNKQDKNPKNLSHRKLMLPPHSRGRTERERRKRERPRFEV